MSTHRLRRSLPIVAAAALLAGCGAEAPLMTPGAREVTFHLWGEPGAPPTVIQAERLTQESGDFTRLRFEDLRVRSPYADGVVVLEAPSGTYAKDERDTLKLEGPVRISGSMRGDPIAGAAHRATVRDADRAIELFGADGVGAAEDEHRQVTLVLYGRTARAWSFRIDGLDRKGGSMRIDSTPHRTTAGLGAPAVTAALAALPKMD